MFFTRSLSSVAPKASRPRAEGRSPRRRAAAFRLETLEARDLKSGIPGIDLWYGTLTIQGTQYSGNVSSVTKDANTNTLRVSLNGQVAEFNASEVHLISYTSGWGGSDTFVNDTSICTMMNGIGDNNHFYGGSTFNTVYMQGDYSTYDARGGASYVYSFGGTHNVIAQYSNQFVYSY